MAIILLHIPYHTIQYHDDELYDVLYLISSHSSIPYLAHITTSSCGKVVCSLCSPSGEKIPIDGEFLVLVLFYPLTLPFPSSFLLYFFLHPPLLHCYPPNFLLFTPP